MRLDPKLWRHFGGSQLVVDAGVLVVLGTVMGFVLLNPGVLSPVEGGLVMGGVGFLLILGRRALAWPKALPTQSFLPEWAERVLGGERRPTPPPQDLEPDQRMVASALGQAMEEILALREDLAFLRRSMAEDWADTDEELDRLERAREEGFEAQARMIEEMEGLGRELKSRLNAPDLAARVTLRTRGLGLDGQIDRGHFREEVALLRQGLERLGELVDQVKDSVPRLRREAEQLTALAFAGGRRASRLWAAIQSMGGQAQRLMESSRYRNADLAALRALGDRLREEGEWMRRRMIQMRGRGDTHSEPLGRIEESVRAVDQVAQQTGLLAVNAAILAQDQKATRGFQVIGSKIRLLAEQTAQGTAEVSRGLAEHRQGLEAEERRLDEIQAAVDRFLSVLHDFQGLHTRLDHQGTELERSLESHLDHVKVLEEAGSSAGEALREIHARSEAVQGAVLRQYATEQEAGKERQDILGRLGRVEEGAMRLLRSEESALGDLWMVLDRHAQVRCSASYRAFQEGRFQAMDQELLAVSIRERQSWRRLAWSRATHRRLAARLEERPMEGRRDSMGRLQLLLLRRDALGMPRPSALVALRPDLEGRHWELHLHPAIRGQEVCLSLLVALRECLSSQWVGGPELLLGPEGVKLDLGMPLPDLPELLAGLEAMVSLPEGYPEPGWVVHAPRVRMEQRFLWMRASLPVEDRAHLAANLHEKVSHLASHEYFLQGVARPDPRPCRRCARGEQMRALAPPHLRDLGLGRLAVDSDPVRGQGWIEVMGLSGRAEADSPLVLGAVAMPYARPEALLLALIHPDAALGFDQDPALDRIRGAFLGEVLGGGAPDPTARAWELLEELVQGDWIAPLP